MSAEMKAVKNKDRIKSHWYDNEGIAGYIFIAPWLLGFFPVYAGSGDHVDLFRVYEIRSAQFSAVDGTDKFY